VLAWQSATVVGVPIAKDVASASSIQATGTPPKGGGAATVTLSTGAAFYTSVHTPADYVLKHPILGDSQLPDQPIYLRLEVFPITTPTYRMKDGCHNEIPGPTSKRTPNFIPLNDAQWTIEGFYEGGSGANRAGYSIAVPAEGWLLYEDHTSAKALPTGPFNLGSLVQSKSIWYLTINRKKASP
jgi:hypothetical protein